MSLELGQTAFRRGRKTADQTGADYEPQNGVAQEFKLLVIAGGRSLARLLMDSGLVRECALEQVGSSRVDLQACKLEYSIVSPK